MSESKERKRVGQRCYYCREGYVLKGYGENARWVKCPQCHATLTVQAKEPSHD